MRKLWKFIKFLLVVAVLLGVLGAYVLLTNGKMMWHVVQKDTADICVDVNKAMSKVAKSGNFNLDIEYETTEDSKQCTYSGNIIIKSAGVLNSAFSAHITKTIGSTTTQTFFYCEQNQEGTISYEVLENNEKVDGEPSFPAALKKATGGNPLVNMILSEDGQLSEEQFIEQFVSAKLTISFKPFFVGSNVTLQKDSTETSIKTGLKGYIRQIVSKSENGTAKITVNKPGKTVVVEKAIQA